MDLKIIKLSIRNYLRIVFYKTDKLGKLNLITGGNEVGKTSFVQAIKEAFKSSGNDPGLITIGENKAEIFVTLNNGIEIQRKISMGGNTVKVIKEGQPLDSPQKFLNSLIGGLQFNPIEFALAKEKPRRTMLLSAMPFQLKVESLVNELGGQVDIAVLDLSTFDFSKHGLEVLADIQKHVYDRRHEQGIIVDQLTKSIREDRKRIPETLNVKKFEDFDLNTKIEERSTMEGIITAQEKDEESLDALRDLKTEKENEIKRKEDDLVRLKSELKEIQSRGSDLYDKTARFERPDTAAIIAEIDAFQEFREFSLQLKAIEDKKIDLESAGMVHRNLNDLHKALVNEIPKKLLAEIKLPIDDLTIDGDKILIGGVPLDKMADSAKIKISVEIAQALCGDLKVICIDRFETLEEKNRMEFLELAAKPHPRTGVKYEYFITEVTKGDLKVDSQNGQAEIPLQEKPKPKKKEGF